MTAYLSVVPESRSDIRDRFNPYFFAADGGCGIRS
jgi:hypothetical protein